MPPRRLSHSFLLVSVSPRSHPVNILWLRGYLKSIEHAVPISDRLRSARTFQSLTVWDGHSPDVIRMPITRTRLARHLTSATHNRNAAASSLPIELLSEIFQVGLAGYPPHSARSSFHQISRCNQLNLLGLAGCCAGHSVSLEVHYLRGQGLQSESQAFERIPLPLKELQHLLVPHFWNELWQVATCQGDCVPAPYALSFDHAQFHVEE